MKKLHLFTASALIITTVFLGGAKLVSAYGFHAGNNVTTSSSQQINDTLYLSGRTIDMDSEVFGDVFCAGQNVNISGIVHGDVICAGQTVNVSGKVDGDVRLAGQTITLSAAVSGNATIAGQSFVLLSNGIVGGDITLGSTDATLNGRIGRDVVAGSNNLIVDNEVGRNIKVASETLKLSSGARVGGNVELTSENAASKDSQAVVSGKITRTAPKQGEAKSKHAAIFGFGIIWFIYCFVAMLVTAMALALLFPRALHAASNKAMPRPWKALLTGFVATIAVPIVILLLAATIIGLPFAFLAGLLWFVALLLSGPLFGYYIGRLVLRDSRQPLVIMLAGASILIVLYFIPVIGMLAVLAALWIGTGMVLLEAFDRTPKPEYTLAPTKNKKTSR